LEGACQRQAELTFAVARHAVVDLSMVFNSPPREPDLDRLSPADLAFLRTTLAAAGLRLREGSDADQKLSDLRLMYEPYAYSLSNYFSVTVPPWIFRASRTDNWQMSAWGRSSGLKRSAPSETVGDQHF
jgi:hypothetical protein